jgi:hypothetical protein
MLPCGVPRYLAASRNGVGYAIAALILIAVVGSIALRGRRIAQRIAPSSEWSDDRSERIFFRYGGDPPNMLSARMPTARDGKSRSAMSARMLRQARATI